MPDATPTTFTAEEVAALLRCNVRTVLSEARQGRLPAIRLGRLYRFPRRAIEAMLNEGIPATATQPSRPTPRPVRTGTPRVVVR